ncbi:MAG TPA: CdaR family protein [Nannocystaceae bacterium]|nr:CdaR family protein [Nannocystaceae bacterium]
MTTISRRRSEVLPPPSRRARAMKVLGDLVQLDWGTKTLAFVITVLLFVLTRDEVTRTFNVPLRVVPDPERVLLTAVPDNVAVQVRGPWSRVNRLGDHDFGSAQLDLRAAVPGPLQIDRASIVMPRGVVLAEVVYDEVDLRFEPVVEREVPVLPIVIGQPAADYQLVRVRAQPATMRVRGGRSSVLAVAQLSTEGYDVRGADHEVSQTLALVRPPMGVEIVGEGAEPMRVKVVAEIGPIAHQQVMRAPVQRDAALGERGGIAPLADVTIHGPMPAFRELARLGLVLPVIGHAAPAADAPSTHAVIKLRWAEAVPPSLQRALSFEPSEVRVELPPPPPPSPEPTPLPAP